MLRLLPSLPNRSDANPGIPSGKQGDVTRNFALLRLLTQPTAHQLSNELPFTANFPAKLRRPA